MFKKNTGNDHRCFGDRILKSYTCDHKYDMEEIVLMIDNGPHHILRLHIEDEDADVGMRMFGGDCTVSGFREFYDKCGCILKSVMVYFSDIPVTLSVFENGNVVMMTKDEKIEFQDLICEPED